MHVRVFSVPVNLVALIKEWNYIMPQIFDEDRKQRASENMDGPERYSLHLARITGILLLLASIGGVTFFSLEAFFGTWGDPNVEGHAAVAFAAYHLHPLIISLLLWFNGGRATVHCLGSFVVP